MKKQIFILTFMVSSFNLTYSQALIFNDALWFQLGENHIARMGSEELYRKSFEEQQELYTDINKNLVQVLATHELIYNSLSKINTTLKQGKKLKYFYEYSGKIARNSIKFRRLTLKYPQYAILYTKVYKELLREATGFSDQLVGILEGGKNNLMDTYEREVIIERMLTRLRIINGTLLLIILRLERGHKIAYLQQVPILKDYISLDKAVVQNIMYKWKILKQ